MCPTSSGTRSACAAPCASNGEWETDSVAGPLLTEGTSITVGADGTTWVAHSSVSEGGIFVASDADGEWTSDTVDEGTLSRFPSIGVDSFDGTHVAYIHADHQARYATNTFGDWEIEDFGETDYGSGPVLRIDAADFAHVVYGGSQGLRYDTNAGGSWDEDVVFDDSADDHSLAIDRDGAAHVAFHDVGGASILYATNPSAFDRPSASTTKRQAWSPGANEPWRTVVVMEPSDQLNETLSHWRGTPPHDVGNVARSVSTRPSCPTQPHPQSEAGRGAWAAALARSVRAPRGGRPPRRVLPGLVGDRGRPRCGAAAARARAPDRRRRRLRQRGRLPRGPDAARGPAGEAREFILVLPEGLGPDEVLPVVFLWHWLGGEAQDFLERGEVQAAVDAQRFAAVIPESKGDLQLQWPYSLIDSDRRIDEEATFFDDMLACVAAEYVVNRNCVSSAGVSAGALWTSQLAPRRAGLLSSFLSLSGGVGEDGDWFNPIQPWAGAERAMPALVLWGGPTDFCGVNFQSCSQHLEDALVDDGGFLVECIHDCSHAEPPLTPPDGQSKYSMLWRFVLDHPFWLDAGTSPYQAGGLPADFPEWCAVGAGNAHIRDGECDGGVLGSCL